MEESEHHIFSSIYKSFPEGAKKIMKKLRRGNYEARERISTGQHQ
jgi:hypothetical protein